ncbi:LLM class flavin-dependent oxidoreductase [Chelatococcus asaccharovorans]|uniref:FMN-dependent oxidoreductase (Nitrilotriacetate monooxygenase family) n=1 Tax=Chelatococcus asaccharovorans TaxID=28210 RepID=A0A2V3U5E3_9HYPH|nr:LLM class flavin-dependent oxidoreductase [Chelatococcus asaccharovorans]MBS7703767.1 LLM class flavin-dependent oxidoreductase [Chelatococcus asaccharovorans]PXW57927.1 FMN-dependent oxidoreductase (nitrilotriacetate monooxygenase family) [Chelatococcus asaccharovorans]
MSSSNRQLSLNLFIYPGGHHEAAWRYPSSAPERAFDITYYQELARRAEAAKFDAIFFADGPVLADNIRYSSRFRLEPLTWLSAIAAATSRIGLIATSSTTYYEPYNLARLFASLDHLSGGRAGWNIVTTGAAQASANFGYPEQPNHAERYAKAAEFVDVVTKLWDSWEDDALVIDKDAGIFADDEKIHAIDHVGPHFRVKGPFNTARSPQGRPVYVQAGSSDDGRSFAARYAEAIFTAHQTLISAQRFYADIKHQAAGLGRNPDHIKILPGISPYIGSTEAEAQRLFDEFNHLVQPAYSLGQLRNMTGLDLTGHDLDGPFPRHLIDTSGPNGVASRFQLVVDIIDREKPTIRQLINRLAGARGHYVSIGTPEKIADEIQTWFETGAADGFNIMPPWLTGGFDAFAGEVLPLLRKRGLFREEYAGRTLRDHFDLPRPDSIFSGVARASA